MAYHVCFPLSTSVSISFSISMKYNILYIACHTCTVRYCTLLFVVAACVPCIQ